MKFDCVIGNPPFSDNTKGKSDIYSKFYNKAKRMSDVVCMITPSTLFKGKQAPSGLYFIKDTSKYFKIVMQTCAFIETKVSNDEFICNDFKLKKGSIIVFDKVLSKIVNKMYVIDHYKFKRYKSINSIHSIKTVDRINANTLTYTTTNKIMKDNKSYYVINSYMRNCKPWLAATKIIKPGITIPDKYRAIKCRTKLEAESIHSQLTSDLYMYVQQNTHTSYTLDGPQTKFCVKLDKNKIWTNDDINDHFGLTEEERITVQRKM